MSLAGMDEVSPELVDAAMGILLELLYLNCLSCSGSRSRTSVLL